MVKTLRSFWLVALFVFGIAFSAHADDEFTRLKSEGSASSLQTAYATYESADGKFEIVLYGVVHIAEKDYYKRVQSDLDSYDIVLWEGVRPADGKKVEPSEDMKQLGRLQKTMGELLGLTFQKDGINYERDHFVHADMSYEEFQEALGGKGKGGLNPFGGVMDKNTMKMIGPVLEQIAGFGKQLMKSNPAMRDRLKTMMAKQLSSTKNVQKQLGSKMGDVILNQRNDVVMEVLEETLATNDGGSIAIFYGAAHMPDFHKRLVTMGYKQVDKRWVSAWDMGGGVPSDDPLQPTGQPREEAVPTGSGEGRWF